MEYRELDVKIKRDMEGSRRYDEPERVVKQTLRIEHIGDIINRPHSVSDFIDDFSYLGGMVDLFAYTYLYTPGSPGQWMFMKKDITLKAIETVEEIPNEDGSLVYEVTVSDSSIYRATRHCNRTLRKHFKIQGKEGFLS